MQYTNLQKDSNKLLKKAKRKYINYPFMSSLLDLQSKNYKFYLLTASCLNTYQVENNDVKAGFYCKLKCCPNCNNIRTGIRISNYLHQLPEILHFGTVTVPNCTINKLSGVIKKMLKDFHQIREQCKRKGYPITGIASLEITINIKTKTYHPHIHYLISSVPIWRNKQPYELKYHIKEKVNEYINGYMVGSQQTIKYHNLVNERWLILNPTANENLQNIKPVHTWYKQGENGQQEYGERSVFELFKYLSKPQTPGKILPGQTIAQFKKQEIRKQSIYSKMYDELFTVMKGKRTFFTYNLRLPLTEEQENDQFSKTKAIKSIASEGVYNWQKTGWVSSEGEVLAHYEPTKKEQQINKMLLQKTKKLATIVSN